MGKTLATLTLLGIEVLNSLGVVGCITLPEIERRFPEGHISNVKYSTLTQEKVPYKLEEQVIYNDRQYFCKKEKTPETLPIVILRYEDVTRELDLNSGKIRLQAKKKYIPRLDEGNYLKDKWTDWVVLRTDNPYGVRAYMLSSEQLKNLAKGSKNDYGYSVVTTDEGASFAIKTIKILGEEYFFPHVEKTETNKKGKLNYYLIPVKGAKIRIDNKCGNLSIYNENKVYRPIDPEVYPELFNEKEDGIHVQNKSGN